ncbi:MAG: hypothetical protein IT431_09305 [Phycisphaerales bacterium]|nr:hypothetical protein [Phycisphaerales bacterium]
MISWLTILPCITLAFGVVLLARGLRGTRSGQSPHCARCDFDLTGLDAARAGVPARCPECGSPTDARRAVILGDRRGQPGSLWSGAVLLAFSVSVPFYLLTGPRMNWFAVVPTGALIGWADSSGNRTANSAATELLRRHAAEPLDGSELRRFFDACVARGEPLPGPSASLVWGPLLDAAYDAGVVDAGRQEAHLRVLFGPAERTYDRLPAITLAGEPFPGAPGPGGPGLDLTPMLPFERSWSSRRRSFGVVATLEHAAMDGEPLSLVGSGAADRPSRWVRYGALPGSTMLDLPAPSPSLGAFAPDPGRHTLELRWRLGIYRIDEDDADTAPLTRPPDFTLHTSLTHQFLVASSVEEVVRIVTPDQPDAPPPPSLVLDGPDAAIVVTQRRPLADGQGWLYELSVTLRREPRTSEADYAVLGVGHLEIDGRPFESVDPRGVLAPGPEEARPRGSGPRFYDPAPSAGPSRSRRFDGNPRPVVLQVLDLPRVDRADLVITPTPRLVLDRPTSFPEQAYWGGRIVLRGVPLDWSAIDLAGQSAQQPVPQPEPAGRRPGSDH